jgi:hypothetical protein
VQQCTALSSLFNLQKSVNESRRSGLREEQSNGRSLTLTLTSVVSFLHSPWAVPGLVVAEAAVRLSDSRVRRRRLQARGALSVVASLILTRQ